MKSKWVFGDDMQRDDPCSLHMPTLGNVTLFYRHFLGLLCLLKQLLVNPPAVFFGLVQMKSIVRIAGGLLIFWYVANR
jgi:hypothetical protein